jgi:hypothetical protein
VSISIIVWLNKKLILIKKFRKKILNKKNLTWVFISSIFNILLRDNIHKRKKNYMEESNKIEKIEKYPTQEKIN